MTQPLDLDAIEQRANNATDGPWWNDSHEIYTGHGTADDQWIAESCNIDLPDKGATNGTFIANARTDVPAMAAEIRRLRAELEQGRKMHAEVPLYLLAEDCPHPEPDDDQPEQGDAWADRHPTGMDQTGYTGDRLCLDSPIGRSVCGICLDFDHPEDPAAWPCKTAVALGLHPSA